MSAKKAVFGARPKPATVIDPAAADAFVAGGAEQPTTPSTPAPETQKHGNKAKLKRLTIDLEPSLHKQAKRKSVDRGESLADVIRKFLEQYVSR